MSSTDEENKACNTHLREKFVMQENPNLNYNIMTMKECPRCKEHEPNFSFTNCSFDVVHRDGKAIQIFECTRCQHKWEIEYK